MEPETKLITPESLSAPPMGQVYATKAGGWWIVSNSFSQFRLHEEEIAALRKLTQKGDEKIQGAFYWSDKARYADVVDNGGGAAHEVMFGKLNPDPTCLGNEMAMRWHELGLKRPAPRLEIFDDSWKGLAQFPDVFRYLAANDSKNITPQQFVDALLALGFEDITPYDNPHGHGGQGDDGKD